MIIILDSNCCSSSRSYKVKTIYVPSVPHAYPLGIANEISELDEEQLKRPGGNAFSDGAYEASDESVIALKEIINKALKEINS